MIESSLHQKGDSLMLNIMIKSNINMEKVNKCLKKIGLENFQNSLLTITLKALINKTLLILKSESHNCLNVSYIIKGKS